MKMRQTILFAAITAKNQPNSLSSTTFLIDGLDTALSSSSTSWAVISDAPGEMIGTVKTRVV
jgi:hypothetical protein